MDQTASAYQKPFLELPKMPSNTNLDCNLNLCLVAIVKNVNLEEVFTLFTDIKHHAFRETPNFTGTFRQTNDI